MLYQELVQNPTDISYLNGLGKSITMKQRTYIDNENHHCVLKTKQIVFHDTLPLDT